MNKDTYGNKPLPFPPEIAHNPKPKPIVSTYRPPLTQSAWSSSQLSTKPFWETNNTTSNVSSSSQQQQQQQQQMQQQYPQQEEKQQQYFGNVVSSPPSPPLAHDNWGQPLFTPQQQQQQQQQQPTPSPQSSTSTPASAMSRKHRRSLGSFASKYATRPPPPPSDATPTYITSPATVPTPSSSSSSSSSSSTSAPVVISGTISLVDLLAPPPPPPSQQSDKPPLFELDIELIPGVTTRLPVYETDDYASLVTLFAEKHQLSITPDAQRMFANKIQQMASELDNLRAQQS